MSRIAVLIPVFNQNEALRRTLRSVDRQQVDFTIFVVDDGSEPAVELNAGDFCHQIRLMTLPDNRGCTEARNAALSKILDEDFDYVALQDAGDVDVGERMQMQAAYLDQHPEVAVVGGWAQYVDLNGKQLYLYKAPPTSVAIRARMPYVSAFAHPASMIRLNALREVGVYDPAYVIASDYEIFFRLTRRFETVNIQEVVIHKEDNPAGLSLGKRRRSVLYRLKAQFQHFRPGALSSYLGVLSSLVLLIVPYRMVASVKQWRGFAE